jgi:hypothetical protein
MDKIVSLSSDLDNYMDVLSSSEIIMAEESMGLLITETVHNLNKIINKLKVYIDTPEKYQMMEDNKNRHRELCIKMLPSYLKLEME